MPYKILKNENYENLGGMNTKVSPYTTGPHEFLNLSNYEFSIPGALNKRPGSSQYLLAQTGFTPIVGFYEFVSLRGQSMIMYGQNGNMYWLQNSQSFTLLNGLQNNQLYFKTFVDRVFFSNGNDFNKWDGLTTGYVSSGVTQIIFSDFLYSLPVPFTGGIVSAATPTHPTPGVHGFNGTTATFLTPSLLYTYSVGFVNDRGFHGPASSTLWIQSVGGTQAQGLFFTSDAGAYAYASVTNNVLGTTTFGGPNPQFGTGNIIGIPASFGINYFGSSGTTCYYDILGGPYGGASGLNRAAMAVYRDNGPGTARYRVGYAPLDPTDYTKAFAFIDQNYPQSTFPEPTCVGYSLQPRFTEVYNNQLFMGGFSLFPSIVQFSDIGEPEGVQPGSNFEVRTNDGDRVTGFKTFYDRLTIFKQNSFHVLNGSNLNNFQLTEVSAEYGCISHNAVAIYETYLLFLDKKGIIRYNGANIETISTKMEPVFQRMNVTAAYDKAFMVHFKEKNQIWCAIPVDGSTVNNLIVVYDYLLGSWSKFEGLNINQLVICLADRPALIPFFSDYSGMIHNFGASYYGDNGRGITTIAQARFLADSGQTVQKLYRQLFLNSRSVNGSTLTFGIKFYNNYGTSVALATTMVVSAFQNRIDFGLSVKSLSIEIDDFNSTDQQIIHGYALSSRFLRDV